MCGGGGALGARFRGRGGRLRAGRGRALFVGLDELGMECGGRISAWVVVVALCWRA